jgi:hypothetical protein
MASLCVVGQNTEVRRRHQAINAPRELVDHLLSNDIVQARNAAYSIIVRSRPKDGAIDPRGSFTSLTPDQQHEFKRELKEIVAQSSVDFVTSMSARRLPRKPRQPHLIEIVVRASKVLAFDLDGERILVGPNFPVRLTRHNLLFTCPVATRMLSHEFYQGDGIDCVFEAKAKFMIDWRYKQDEVPCIIQFAGAIVARNVALEAIKASD